MRLPRSGQRSRANRPALPESSWQTNRLATGKRPDGQDSALALDDAQPVIADVDLVGHARTPDLVGFPLGLERAITLFGSRNRRRIGQILENPALDVKQRHSSYPPERQALSGIGGEKGQ